jgi:hypothetical protein
MVALPFVADRLWQRNIWGLFELALPLGLGVAAYIGTNLYLYDHPMPSPVDLEWGTPLRTWIYQWIAWDHGLLTFTPVAFLALLGSGALWRSDRRFSAVVLGTFLIYYTFISSISIWTGGYCYGPRYLVPVIPVLMLGLVGYLKSPRWGSDWGIGVLGIVGAVSVTINLFGAVPYWEYWTTHPFVEL